MGQVEFVVLSKMDVLTEDAGGVGRLRQQDVILYLRQLSRYCVLVITFPTHTGKVMIPTTLVRNVYHLLLLFANLVCTVSAPKTIHQAYTLIVPSIHFRCRASRISCLIEAISKPHPTRRQARDLTRNPPHR
jgi:hypothetical protein